MSLINIKIDFVKSSCSSLGSKASIASDIGRGLSSLGYSIDPKIKRRCNIAQRMSGAAHSVFKIEQELRDLKKCINTSMGIYSDAEERLVRIGKQKYSLDRYLSKDTQEKIHKDVNSGFSFIGDLGKYAVTAQSLFAIAFVLGKGVQFSAKNGNKARAVIHTAKWIRGKGDNDFFKRMAKSLDKSFRNPGPIMNGFIKADSYIEKIAKAQLLGVSKAKNFNHYLRNVIAGVKEGTSGIATSKIPRMITKRIYPLDASINIAEEVWNIGSEYSQGKLDGKDWAVAGSNIVIKTGATTAGAIFGGIAGIALGPAGAGVGTYIGGMAGAWLGDSLAGIAEDAILKGPETALKNTGKDIKECVGKGFNWVKGIFK